MPDGSRADEIRSLRLTRKRGQRRASIGFGSRARPGAALGKIHVSRSRGLPPDGSSSRAQRSLVTAEPSRARGKFMEPLRVQLKK